MAFCNSNWDGFSAEVRKRSSNQWDHCSKSRVESAETGNVVVEGDVDLDSVGHEVFERLELVELVLACHILAVCDDHTSHETTKGSDAVALADAKNRGINMCGTSAKSFIGVRDGAAGVVVEMRFDAVT